jgi:acetyltransferase-like isoleucine patch superfamily enzyme
MRRAAEYRFRRQRACLEIGAGAQIRSIALRPTSGGTFALGENAIFAGQMAMDREGASVRIGARTYIGKGLIVAAKSVEIGADVLLSWNVTIVDHHSHSLEFSKRANDVTGWLTGKKDWSHVEIAPVRIGDKVWIGFGASILPGVTIGEGAIVGAASVVTRDVEPWTVVAGNPARVIRQLERPVS